MKLKSICLFYSLFLISQSVFAKDELPLNRSFGFGAELMPINVYKNGVEVKSIKYKDSNTKLTEEGDYVDYKIDSKSAFASRTWDHEANGNFSRCNMEVLKNADGSTKQVVYSENTNRHIEVSVLSLSGSKVKSETTCQGEGAAWAKNDDDLFCVTVTAPICQKLYQQDTFARLKTLRAKLNECVDLRKTAEGIYTDIGMSGDTYDELRTENINKINSSAATQKTVSPDRVATQSKKKKDQRYKDFRKLEAVGESLSSLADAFSKCQKLELIDSDYAFPNKDGAKTFPQKKPIDPPGDKTKTPVGEV